MEIDKILSIKDDIIKHHKEEISTLKQQLQVSIEALEFYADKKSWNLHFTRKYGTLHQCIDEKDLDEREDYFTNVWGGKRARNAIEQIKTIK
jgi:hypothetical protein